MVNMVRFGRCSVDVAARSVERDGEAQHLEPQAFDLLAYLMSQAGRVVAKAELFDEVWGDQFVSESALTTRVKEVRQALGDDGTRQAVIKNYRGRGYRFVAELDDDTSPADDRARSLSSLTTSLVGRDGDISSAAALLATARLVTLVGPGGVGKTTLADEVARHVRDRHDDGVRTIRLAQISDPASVLHVFRRDAGLMDTALDDDALIDVLAEHDVLYVVDNCEHVLAEVARIIAAILALGGDARFLATSRERLGVSSEHVVPVAPLDESAARELLLVRARSARPGYTWSTDDEPCISRLLQAIDRLPLAIEMAGARLPMIGPVDLEHLLATKLGLLRSADRSAAGRHGTLDALIAWSEDLLDDDERDLLAAMTTFAGAVTIADIATVVETEPAPLAVGPLAGLVDKSLVVAHTGQSPTRYQLLETVRARASPRRRPESDARHARHVVDVVNHCDRMIRTPDEAVAARRLDALTAEIRAAHEWCRTYDPSLACELTAALLHYAHERQWAEPASWAGSMVDRLDSDDPGALAVAASLAADASNRAGYDEAAGLAAHAVTSEDSRVAGSARDTLLNVGIYTGDLVAAHRHSHAMIELAETAGDTALRTSGIVGGVLAFVYAGELDDGNRAFRRMETDAALSRTSEAWIAYTRGELYSAAGQQEQAIEQFERAVALGSGVGSHFVVNVAEVSSLAVTTRVGDTARSFAAFVPLLVRYRRARSDTHAITTLRNLIEVMARADMHEPAMILLGALSRPDVKATYGIESERLVEAQLRATDAAGAATVEGWMELGAARDAGWAVDYAIEVLTTIDDRD